MEKKSVIKKLTKLSIKSPFQIDNLKKLTDIIINLNSLKYGIKIGLLKCEYKQLICIKCGDKVNYNNRKTKINPFWICYKCENLIGQNHGII